MELAQPAAGPFSTFSLWARGTGRDRASVDPPQASRALTPAQAFQPTELGRGEGPDDTEGPEIPSAAIWHDERPRYIQVLDRLPEHRKGQMDPSQGTTQKRQSSPGTHPFDNAITAANISAKAPAGPHPGVVGLQTQKAHDDTRDGPDEPPVKSTEGLSSQGRTGLPRS